MKKIFVLVLLLIISTISFSQSTIATAPVLTKSDYLQKSKSQKTAAIILAAGSGALITIGLATWSSGFSNGLDFTNPGSDAGTKEMNTGTGLVIAGSALILGSIPLFIASSKNKLKGMSLSFKNESVTLVQKNSFAYRSVPSLSLKINL